MELDPRKTMIIAILVLSLGKYINQKIAFFRKYNIPELVTGGIITNLLPLIIPKMKCFSKFPTLAITSDLSLGLFLAMAMMALKFWEIGSESIFLLTNIFIQTIALHYLLLLSGLNKSIYDPK